jgi:3-oxoacyl-[acyl-carrier protein] reductase
VVTGAARGLGRAIAERLAQDAQEIVAIDVDGDGARVTAEICGGRAYQCDISDRARVQEIAREVGAANVLVNNAGIWRYGSLIACREEDVDAVIATNLLGTLNCCRAFAPSIIAEGGGAIVNLSSAAAALALTTVEVYPVTKGAIEALTRQLAQELGPKGVRVNAIGPGQILTEGTAATYEGARHAQRAQQVPLGRIGTPQDVANAVSFLVSDQASYISGQILYVDGGLTAGAR